MQCILRAGYRTAQFLGAGCEGKISGCSVLTSKSKSWTLMQNTQESGHRTVQCSEAGFSYKTFRSLVIAEINVQEMDVDAFMFRS